jgi:iron complex transport system permease protein
MATKPTFIILLLLLLTCFILDTAFGSVKIPFTQVIQSLIQPLDNTIWENIIWKIRFPKALTAISAGMALAVAGLQMQTLFKNNLASPSALGITSGASLGVAIIVLASGASLNMAQTGLALSSIMVISAILGSVLVMLLVLFISRRTNNPSTLLIIGLMISGLTLSLVGVWQFFSSPEQIQAYLVWTFGSLSATTLEQASLLFVITAMGLVGSLIISKQLNVLLLGDNYAKSLGLNIKILQPQIIILTSVLAGTVTAFCGPIGFVGIAVPHIVRNLFPTINHWTLTPACAIAGAILLLLCDILSQTASNSYTLPINAITSLVGSPIVIWIVLKWKR